MRLQRRFHVCALVVMVSIVVIYFAKYSTVESPYAEVLPTVRAIETVREASEPVKAPILQTAETPPQSTPQSTPISTPPANPPPVYFPEINETDDEAAMDWKDDLLQHFAVGLITTQSFHHRLQYARQSWWTSDFDPIVEVFSDNTTSNVTFDLPNLIDTGCDTSYHMGLWCKNMAMFKRWREDPKFADVHWFWRAMDDSAAHFKNMVWLARQYDWRKPIVLGTKDCWEYDYPDGGPGFLISRGLLNSPTLLDSWNATLSTQVRGKTTILDDALWGILIVREKAKFYHNNGFTHNPLNSKSELYNYYLRQRGHEWPVTWRPVAWHSPGKNLQSMPEVYKALHSIDYANLSTTAYHPPLCKCIPGRHSVCAHDTELIHRHKKDGPCAWANTWLDCIGVGPFPNSVNTTRPYNMNLALVKAGKKTIPIPEEEPPRRRSVEEDRARKKSPVKSPNPSKPVQNRGRRNNV